MTALALDLGATVGWAKGAAVGPVEYGSFAMPNTSDLGAYLAGADPYFPKLMRGMTTIAIEQPFVGDIYLAARKLLALLGHAYYHAHYQGIAQSHIEEIAVPTAKHTMAGHGRAEKPAMILASSEYWGFDPDQMNEHEADALAILRVHLFGRREAIRPARVRSGKGSSVKRPPA